MEKYKFSVAKINPVWMKNPKYSKRMSTINNINAVIVCWSSIFHFHLPDVNTRYNLYADINVQRTRLMFRRTRCRPTRSLHVIKLYCLLTLLWMILPAKKMYKRRVSYVWIYFSTHWNIFSLLHTFIVKELWSSIR